MGRTDSRNSTCWCPHPPLLAMTLAARRIRGKHPTAGLHTSPPDLPPITHQTSRLWTRRRQRPSSQPPSPPSSTPSHSSQDPARFVKRAPTLMVLLNRAPAPLLSNHGPPSSTLSHLILSRSPVPHGGRAACPACPACPVAPTPRSPISVAVPREPMLQMKNSHSIRARSGFLVLGSPEDWLAGG